MAIEFRCGQCSKLLRTTDDKAGASAKCPQCGCSVTVPAAAFPDDDLFDDVILSVAPPMLPRAGSSPFQGETSEDRTSSRRRLPRACPMCGDAVASNDTRCPSCGERLPARAAAPRSRASREGLRPHRGGMILAFGILGWFTCPVFSLLAAFMGNEDLKEIEAGRMDPAGESMTQAGKIVGIVNCVLILLGILVFCGVSVLFGLLAA